MDIQDLVGEKITRINVYNRSIEIFFDEAGRGLDITVDSWDDCWLETDIWKY